jgi:hypothetical protein
MLNNLFKAFELKVKLGDFVFIFFLFCFSLQLLDFFVLLSNFLHMMATLFLHVSILFLCFNQNLAQRLDFVILFTIDFQLHTFYLLSLVAF